MNNESCLVLISQNNTLIKTAETALARPFHGSYSAFNHFLKTSVNAIRNNVPLSNILCDEPCYNTSSLVLVIADLDLDSKIEVSSLLKDLDGEFLIIFPFR